MKLDKIANTRRNVRFGVSLKIYQIILPFVFRTIMVRTLGVEYLGLNSLFTSVLQVLNLAELGVGSAMVFSMYKPIADDDADTICALMQLYKLYYNIIGAVVLVIGLITTPVIPRLINDDVPDSMNIYVLYLMNLIATVLSYWLFAYKNSILMAHQRIDISNKVTIFTDTIKYGFQLLALYVFANYYYYVIAILITQVVNNIITAIIADKMYPEYKPRGNLSTGVKNEINRRIRDLFTSKFGGVVVNSADTIVISSFLGLTSLAVYQNYFYIINSVMAFVAIINSSVLAGIGNSIILNNNEENYRIFEKFVFIEMWILGVCVCCFLALIQPFMIMWMGEKLKLNMAIVILFCIYFIVYEYIMLMSVYKDAAGIWHEDRFRPLIAGIANLVLNILLVNLIELKGIILSTILSSAFISAPWITKNVFQCIFPKKNVLAFAKNLCLYLVAILTGSTLIGIVCNVVPESGIWYFVFRGILAVLISNIVLLLFFFKTSLFKESLEITRKMIKK